MQLTFKKYKINNLKMPDGYIVQVLSCRHKNNNILLIN